MSLLYESFLRSTNSENIQEWFDDLKNLLENLEDMPDPEPKDVQLAFHLTQMVENFELMRTNLVERRRRKNQKIDDILDGYSTIID